MTTASLPRVGNAPCAADLHRGRAQPNTPSSMGLGAPGVGGPARAQSSNAWTPFAGRRTPDPDESRVASRESRPLSLRGSDSVERLGQGAPPEALISELRESKRTFFLIIIFYFVVSWIVDIDRCCAFL
jgi:hypothetical protein